MRTHGLLSTVLLLTTVVLSQSTATYKPTSGFVPDSKTAVAIAEAVLIPVYGKEHIESERPFSAALKQNVWTIEGTLYCSDGKGGVKTEDCDGGVAAVKISKNDGRILYMLHGK
jgi:NTF2 fold immunity protein of polymorphic toxin system component